MAKNKNYLVRVSQVEGNFSLARGENIGNGLAVVQLYKGLDPIKNTWRIIDVASGLHVLNPLNSSKKKALERWDDTLLKEGRNILNQINEARSKKGYRERVEELQNEKKLWRLSGYEIN